MLQCNAPPSNAPLQEAAVQTAACWLNTAGFQLQQQELMLSTPCPSVLAVWVGQRGRKIQQLFCAHLERDGKVPGSSVTQGASGFVLWQNTTDLTRCDSHH